MTIMNVTNIQLRELPLLCVIRLLNVKVCWIKVNEVFFVDLDRVIISNGATFLIPVFILCRVLCRLIESGDTGVMKKQYHSS